MIQARRYPERRPEHCALPDLLYNLARDLADDLWDLQAASVLPARHQLDAGVAYRWRRRSGHRQVSREIVEESGKAQLLRSTLRISTRPWIM